MTWLGIFIVCFAAVCAAGFIRARVVLGLDVVRHFDRECGR